MKHPTSRMLHTYWDRLRGERSAPERGEIEPGEIRNLLADSLILEIDPENRRAVVRLAGTRVCAMFGRELRGEAFADLWGGKDFGGGKDFRGAKPAGFVGDPWGLVETVAADTVGLIAGLRGTTARDETVDLELLLLPLRHRGRTQSRMLGALSPHCVPAWLGLRPVVALEATSLRVLAPAVPVAPELEPPAPANDTLPFRRGHLMVHPGGRS